VKRTLINEAENKDLRAEILRQAEAYVGLGREAPDPSALAPAFVTTGIVVGVQDGGDAFFDAALAVAKASQNQRERRSIFNVLASTGPKDKVTALLTDALGETFQGQEALFMYYAALANEKSVRDAAWVLFKTNFDALLTRIPEIRKPQTATAVSAFCETDEIAAAEAFFFENAEKIPGYERPLAQSVETARLCEALKAAKADELAAALGVEIDG
ncbi:MAG: ERAP1-like C-terminal domain-containing protein, partial [Pseudomonadota bacterium]